MVSIHKFTPVSPISVVGFTAVWVEFNGIRKCRASKTSQYGNIVSNWKIEKDQFSWKISIPANSTANVYIPGSGITENDFPVENAPGIRFINNEDDVSVYALQSGSYHFGSTLDKSEKTK